MTGERLARRATPWAELDIRPDGSFMAEIAADRERAASPLAGLEHWDINKLLRRNVSQQAPATFNEMMELWVGGTALREVGQDRMQEYLNFLSRFGLDQRFSEIVDDLAQDRGGILECDLGPIQDYLILEAHFDRIPGSAPLILLEVGGGYGRLAELFLRYSSHTICYVLVDGVPESVYYSWEYLRQRLPEHHLGMHFKDQRFDPGQFDAYVLPAWHAKEVLQGLVHCAINVASIQEMPDETVAAYFDFFQQRLAEGSLLFFENSRGFFYVREYSYPDNWLYLVKSATPRSRTLDYPLDLLQVKRERCAAENKSIIEKYYISLKERASGLIKSRNVLVRKEQKFRKKEVSRLQKLLTGHSKTVADLRAKNAEQSERIKELSAEVMTLRRMTAVFLSKPKRPEVQPG